MAQRAAREPANESMASRANPSTLLPEACASGFHTVRYYFRRLIVKWAINPLLTGITYFHISRRGLALSGTASNCDIVRTQQQRGRRPNQLDYM